MIFLLIIYITLCYFCQGLLKKDLFLFCLSEF
nr:MAG TPA: hypothetical protein [Bacteriophage sp.]